MGRRVTLAALTLNGSSKDPSADPPPGLPPRPDIPPLGLPPLPLGSAELSRDEQATVIEQRIKSNKRDNMRTSSFSCQYLKPIRKSETNGYGDLI